MPQAADGRLLCRGLCLEVSRDAPSVCSRVAVALHARLAPIQCVGVVLRRVGDLEGALVLGSGVWPVLNGWTAGASPGG